MVHGIWSLTLNYLRSSKSPVMALFGDVQCSLVIRYLLGLHKADFVFI